MAATNINNGHVGTNLKPSAETVAALAEYDAMKKSPGSYKRRGSFDEMMDAILVED